MLKYANSLAASVKRRCAKKDPKAMYKLLARMKKKNEQENNKND